MHEQRRDPAGEKARLREQFRRYRQALSMAEYERLSGIIVDTVTALHALRTSSRVHVYWPVVEEREIDTRPLIGWLEDRGAEIVLPVVESFRSGEPALRHVRYPGVEGLRKNRWGIAEPTVDDRVDVASLDAVVVPALGAGRNLHRIGHGRGYYDAFLSEVDAPCIGLTYHACLVDDVPSEPHDVALDLLVTEQETIRPSASRPSV